MQVADRFHLWRNLSEAVEKITTAYHYCLRSPASEDGGTVASAQSQEPQNTESAPAELEGKRAANTRARHAAVHELLDKGVGISAVADALGMDRKTVRRYAKASAAGDMLTTPARHRDTKLQPFLAHLHRRWNEGCTDAARLHAEIRELGYRGSQRSVRRCLQPVRASSQPAPPVPTGPRVRQVVGWIIRKPDNLDENEQFQLKQVLARCPELDAVHACVRAFAAMMDADDGNRLDGWIEQADATGLAPLRSFARGLRADHDAVVPGISLSWNSGPVEGHVNRIKMIKRQMFGRASFSLLRKRILLMT